MYSFLVIETAAGGANVNCVFAIYGHKTDFKIILTSLALFQ
jgi:hypothetical protein